MAHKQIEGRSAGQRSRPSDVARSTDILYIPHRELAVYRLTRRLGVSIEVADVVAQLAGLGPREALR